jgi:hypothetical protein
MSKKLFKSWSWEYDEEREEFTILIQDTEGDWYSIGTVSECPRNGMTDEELDEKYNDLMTEVIDELGWKSVWCE